jgi:hypothetical protein
VWLAQIQRGLYNVIKRSQAEKVAERLIPAQFLMVEAEDTQGKGEEESNE